MEFRNLEYARTVFAILKNKCKATQSYDPSKLKIDGSAISVSPDLFGKLERIVEEKRDLIRKIKKPKNNL